MAFPPPFLIPSVLLASIAMLAVLGYRGWQSRSIRILKEACEQALNNEDWGRAEQVALRWREFEPQETDVLVHLADAAQGLQAFDRMVDYLIQVPDDDPRALTMLGLAAEVQFNELVRPFAAEQSWLRMVTIDPRANAPRRKLMYFYALSVQRQKLADQIAVALQTQSESPDAYVYAMLLYELKFTDAFSQVTNWLKSDSENEVLRVAQAYALAEAPKDVDPRFYADVHWKPGDLTLIQQCRQDFPKNFELAAYQLGIALDEANIEEVEQILASAPRDSERDARFWRAKGWSLRAKNQWAEAADSYRRAIALYPLDWRSRHELAQVLRRQGATEESTQLAELALVGKDLEREIMELPDTSKVPPEVLQRIGDYASRAGAADVAQAIVRRLGGAP